MSSNNGGAKSKSKKDWDWYFSQGGGLDQLTKFDERNTGHGMSYQEDDLISGGDDFLDSEQLSYLQGDDEVTSMTPNQSYEVKPFEADILKRVRESSWSDMDYWSGQSASNVNTSAASSTVSNVLGKGRGQRVQERMRRHQVGRPHEYVEGTNMGVEIEEIRDRLSASDLGSEGISNSSFSGFTSYDNASSNGVAVGGGGGGLKGAADLLLARPGNAAKSPEPAAPVPNQAAAEKPHLEGQGQGRKNKKKTKWRKR